MGYSDQEMRGATLFAKLIHALSREPSTHSELADYTGLSYHTVMRYIKAMREQGNIYIADWQEDIRGARTKPAWKLTVIPRRDVPKPVMTGAEKQARYRANKKNRVASVFALGERSQHADSPTSV